MSEKETIGYFCIYGCGYNGNGFEVISGSSDDDIFDIKCPKCGEEATVNNE